MKDDLDYHFDWKNLQILGETDWEQVGSQIYEKWFLASLSSPGKGFLKISKTCPKEGYEEGTLPITVKNGDQDGIWAKALNGGGYPFKFDTDISIETKTGKAPIAGNGLVIDDLKPDLPQIPEGLSNYDGEIRVYYCELNDKVTPLLLVSDQFFYRFDQFTELSIVE